MSKVQLAGNASGTGIFQIAAPNSNTDRTLTLPDSTGTLLNNAAQLAKSLMPTGSVLQVVQGTTSTATSSASSTYTATTLAVSITPSSASSRILVFGQIFVTGSTNTSQPTITLYRGATNLISPGYGFGDIYTTSAGYTEGVIPFSLIDSPSSASSLTYTIYCSGRGAGSCVFGDTARLSVITALEIAG